MSNREAQRINRRMEKVLGRVYAISELLLRSQCLLEAFMLEMVIVAKGGLSDQQLAEQSLEDVQTLRTSPSSRVSSFLFLHLSTLYVVIEKWGEGGFADSDVDRLLENPLVDRLKQFRHGVFHGDDISSARMIRLAQDRDVIDWTKEVVEAFRAVLLDWHENQEERMEEHLLRTMTKL